MSVTQIPTAVDTVISVYHRIVTHNLFMSQNIQVLLCKRLRNFTSGDDTVCISPFNSIQGHCNGVEDSASRFSHQSHQALSNTLKEALNTILLCTLNTAVTASINPLKHGILLNNKQFCCYLTRDMTCIIKISCIMLFIVRTTQKSCICCVSKMKRLLQLKHGAQSHKCSSTHGKLNQVGCETVSLIYILICNSHQFCKCSSSILGRVITHSDTVAMSASLSHYNTDTEE